MEVYDTGELEEYGAQELAEDLVEKCLKLGVLRQRAVGRQDMVRDLDKLLKICLRVRLIRPYDANPSHYLRCYALRHPTNGEFILMDSRRLEIQFIDREFALLCQEAYKKLAKKIEGTQRLTPTVIKFERHGRELS